MTIILCFDLIKLVHISIWSCSTSRTTTTSPWSGTYRTWSTYIIPINLLNKLSFFIYFTLKTLELIPTSWTFSNITRMVKLFFQSSTLFCFFLWITTVPNFLFDPSKRMECSLSGCLHSVVFGPTGRLSFI